MRTHLLLLLPLIAACEGDDAATDDTDVVVDTDADVVTPATFAGAWEVVGDEGVLAPLGLGGARHVRLGEDLSMEVFQANAAGQRTCPVGSWAPIGDGALTLRGTQVWAGEQLLVVASVDDTLVLTDRFGRALTLGREADVPDEERCGVASLSDEVVVQAQKEYWSNLVFDGTSFRIAAEGGVQAIDLATGALSDPQSFGWDSYQLPVTWDGAGPWLSCGCGGSNDLFHRQPGGTELDAIDTTDLGGRIHIEGAARVDAGLMLFGTDSLNVGHLRTLNVDAEPDELVSDVETALDGRGLTLHDGALYLLADHSVSRIDATTGMAEATWTIPSDDPNRRWQGLTSDGTSLWVIDEGDDESGTSVLARLTLE